MKILALLPLLLSLTAFAVEPAEIIDATAFVFEEAFVDPARGREIARKLRDTIIDETLQGRALANAITRATQNIEADGHMNVRFDPEKASEPLASREEIRRRIDEPVAVVRTPQEASEAQVSSRMLDGQVGLVTANSFKQSPGARDEIVAAMKNIEGARSVIVDLRRNGGGSQQLVDFLASYFFPADGRKLMASRFRGEPEAHVGQVVETPTRRFENVPLTILISDRTFSAGEAFAFLMQQYGRARVIGDKTKGGGRHNMFVELGAGFTVSVSVGEVTHAKTGTGWQLTGVVPDVAVPADQALDAALEPPSSLEPRALSPRATD